MTNWQSLVLVSSSFRSQLSLQHPINIQVFKNRFSIIIVALFLIGSVSNVAGSTRVVPLQQQTSNGCMSYFQQRQIVNDDDKWSGLIEFGVSRKQMWGFDVTVVFLFDDKTFKVHGRPIVNFELQKSYYHVLEDILEGDIVRMNVTVPSKFQKSILTVSIELDYQVICEDKNANTGTKGELFSFDFKFKAPSDLIQKVSSEIEYEGKGIRSRTCGVHGEEGINEHTDLDEDRLESKTWPWVASLYIDDKYRCTVNMVTRSEGVTAANCLDPHLESTNLRLETYNNKNYRVRNVTTYNTSFALLFLEDPLSDTTFVPACLGPTKHQLDPKQHLAGSIIGFEKKFHEDYVVLNRVNITTMPLSECIHTKNGSLTFSDSNHNRFCGISKNGLTWLELDGLDGAGFYSVDESSGQWSLQGVIHECVPLNDTTDCDFDSPIVILDLPIDWILNLTLYHPLALERHQVEVLKSGTNEDSTSTLAIWLIVVLTLLCFVGMWGLWYVCRRRNRPLISEVPSLISTNDGIQLLKRENKRFSYLN